MNEQLSQGDRVQLVNMPNDPDPSPVGTTGIVQDSGVELQGQKIWCVRWDNGRLINLLEVL